MQKLEGHSNICLNIQNLKHELLTISNKIILESAVARQFKLDYDSMFHSKVSIDIKGNSSTVIPTPAAQLGASSVRRRLLHSSSIVDSMMNIDPQKIHKKDESPLIKSEFAVKKTNLTEEPKKGESLKIIVTSGTPIFLSEDVTKPGFDFKNWYHVSKNSMVEEENHESDSESNKRSKHLKTDSLTSLSISPSISLKKQVENELNLSRVNSFKKENKSDLSPNEKLGLTDSGRQMSRQDLENLHSGLSAILSLNDTSLYPKSSLSKKSSPTGSCNDDQNKSPESGSGNDFRGINSRSPKEVSYLSGLSSQTNDACRAIEENKTPMLELIPTMRTIEQPEIESKKEIVRKQLKKLNTEIYNIPEENIAKEADQITESDHRDKLDLHDIKKCRELFTRVAK